MSFAHAPQAYPCVVAARQEQGTPLVEGHMIYAAAPTTQRIRNFSQTNTRCTGKGKLAHPRCPSSSHSSCTRRKTSGEPQTWTRLRRCDASPRSRAYSNEVSDMLDSNRPKGRHRWRRCNEHTKSSWQAPRSAS
eukprot:scaffold8141_cov430-Prasinococcus_capsulatus_cf.AAC.1